MNWLISCVVWMLAVATAWPATNLYYVDRDATGTSDNSGGSWANAFTNLTSIPALSAGDFVWLSGGYYSNRLSLSGDGTYSSRITIKASQEVGHNDKVYIYPIDNHGISISGSYFTIDGAMNDDYGTNITKTPDVYLVTNNCNIKVWASKLDGDQTGVNFAVVMYDEGGIKGVNLKWLEITSYTNNVTRYLHGIAESPSTVGGKYNGQTNNVYEYLWIHDVFGDAFDNKAGADDLGFGKTTVRYCYTSFIWDDQFEIAAGWTMHHNIISQSRYGTVGGGGQMGHPDMISGIMSWMRFYNNICYDPFTDAGVFYNGKQTQSNSTVQVYGNLIYYYNYDYDGVRAMVDFGWESGVKENATTNDWWDGLIFVNNTIIANPSELYIMGAIQPYLAGVTYWTNVHFRNNIFANSPERTDFKGWEKDDGGNFYWTNQFCFDYNVNWSTVAKGNEVEFIHQMSEPFEDAASWQWTVAEFNAAYGWTHNKTNQPVFVNETNFDFRLSYLDASARDAGTNLAYLELPGWETDLWGNSRTNDGSVDIGASEYTAPYITNGLLCWLRFEDSFDDNRIDDCTTNGAHMYRFGWTNTFPGSTNWPKQKSGQFGYSAAFMPYFWNTGLWDSNPDFHDGEYGAVTNLGRILQMTQATIMAWSYFSNRTSGNDHNASIIDTGYATNGAWALTRNSDYGEGTMTFIVHTNGIGSGYSAKIIFPLHNNGDPNYGDTNWNHHAVSVNCLGSSLVLTGYHQGIVWTNLTVNFGDVGDYVSFLTASYGDEPPWMAVGVNSHNAQGVETPWLYDDGDEFPNNGWMNGRIDDVRIYNRILSTNEVAQIYLGVESGAEEPEPEGATNLLRKRITGRVGATGRVTF